MHTPNICHIKFFKFFIGFDYKFFKFHRKYKYEQQKKKKDQQKKNAGECLLFLCLEIFSILLILLFNLIVRSILTKVLNLMPAHRMVQKELKMG